MTRPRIGTVFLPSWPPELLEPFTRTADSSGLDDLWLWEDCFAESGPASAVAALAWSQRLRVGIGLMPVPLRNVAITAMEIATIERLFPGRLVPAVGHGVQSWMGQIGARVESPLTLLAEYTDALRQLLTGDEVSVNGRYVTLSGVRLAWPSATPPHLVVGGEGPKTLALAATHGDGTMFTSALSESTIADNIALVRSVTGAQPHEIIAHRLVTRGPDAERLLADDLVSWPAGSAGLAADGPEQVAESIDRLAELGVTTVVVHPAAADPDPVAFARWLGSDVVPLVSG